MDLLYRQWRRCMHYYRTKVFIFTSIFCALFQCKTTPEVALDPEQAKLEKSRNDFFGQSFSEQEYYKVFMASALYQVQQNNSMKGVNRIEDSVGDKSVSAELKRYDKVNLIAEAVLKLEFHPGSGKLKSVRFVSPSPISELDKLMSDDITRWQFKFASADQIPAEMRVKYRVALQKKISRNEAKELLKEYTR